MAEDEPLKGDDSNEQEIGRNMRELLTIKTIGAKVKKYWFKQNGETKPPKPKKSKLGLSPRNKLLLSMYKEEFAIKLKNYVNIERFLPFILILITFFRFVYVNLLLIAYLRFINAQSSYHHKAACQCTLIITYLVFLCRSIIDSLDTQIVPIFTYISVYYGFVPLKSHNVAFMQFWPLISLILSYILYGLLFCLFLFFIPWSICDDSTIKASPNLFWQWFLGWKYIPHIFNGKWRIKYIFDWSYWTSFEIIYCNYLVMSYLPYLFLIGLVFGFLLIRHTFLNIKTVFVKLILQTWKYFKQFYIILIPIILFRFVYLICLWSVFFFGTKHSLMSESNTLSCDIVLFTVFNILIFHSIFDALCSPLVSVEFFMYFKCVQRTFNPVLRDCLKKICTKYIIFPDHNMDSDYNQVMSDDRNEQSDAGNIFKRTKNKNKPKTAKQNLKIIQKKLKISLHSFRKCIGKNGMIVLMSLGWSLVKLTLFYFIFGIIFLFLSVGIIWGHCSDTTIQKTPQIMWEWFVAFKYLPHLFTHNWSLSFVFNMRKWDNIETLFLNYVTICFVPYCVLIGVTILFKIFHLLYKYLVILTEGFNKICGTECALVFIVFIFYRWLYLCYMWYELLFVNHGYDTNMEMMSCRVTLLTVFIVIVFRSMFDSLLCFEFFIYTFDTDLWPLFIIGLLWPVIKLILSYLMFAILSVFFFIGFGYLNCADSKHYLALIWKWFVAPKYLPHLFTQYGKEWSIHCLFNKHDWKSIEILYLNYTITAYVPIFVILFFVFIYYLCMCKQVRNSITFTLFRKRAQLIITMLLSYNCLISFIIYTLTSQMSFMFQIISAVMVGVLPLLIFYKFHKHFLLSLRYYKSIVCYWLLRIIDWDSTFLLFASAVHKYGKNNIVWDKSLMELKNPNTNTEQKCNPNKYYYYYLRAIHTIIKLIFLSLSILLYGIEFVIKLTVLMLYLVLRWIHYWIVISLLYYAKLAQMELFIGHYSKYCMGIIFSENSEESPINTTSNDSNDSTNETPKSIGKIQQRIKNYYLFNLSIFVEVIFQSISVLVIVVINTILNENMQFIKGTTIWILSAALMVIINGLWNILSQWRNRGSLMETLNDQIFGADKQYSIQYGLIRSDIEDGCVIVGDVVQY